MRGGYAMAWLPRGGVLFQTNVPEVGDTYPLTVQRSDINGVPYWAVFSAVTGGYLRQQRATRELAEQDLRDILNKHEEYV